MIIWLNGAFGGGKTTTAAELRGLIGGSRVFDPETVGYLLMANLADYPMTDFRHWPPWRSLVVAAMTQVAGFTGQHLIAPQTVPERDYLEEIVGGLRRDGLEVVHVLLQADAAVLRQRILGSQEAQAWRLDQLDGFLRAADDWIAKEADLVVDTSAVTPAEAAVQIASALPGI
jgi:hypothetical protein